MENLSFLLSTVKRHSLPAAATFCAVTGASLAYWMTTPAQYETSARIMVDHRSASVSDLGQALTTMEGGPQGANPIATQAEIVKSQRVIKRAIDQVFPPGTELEAQAPDAGEVAKRLQISIVPATNILELTYQDGNAQLAMKLLDAIAIAAIEENSEATRQEASAIRQFLENKVPEQQQRLARAEAKENQYREATGIVSVDAQTESLVTSLAAVENQERDLTSQLQEARVRDRMLQQVTGMSALQNAYASIRAGQDENLKQLREELSNLEAAVVEARSRLGDQHPDMLAIAERRDGVRSLYQQRLQQVVGRRNVPAGQEVSDESSSQLVSRYILGEVERTALDSKLQTVQRQRSRLQARVAQLPLQHQPLTALVRQREEAEATLKLLQGKLEEARIAEAQIVSNIRVIDQAYEPMVPSVPKPAVVLVLAVVAGTVLAAGVIAVSSILDDTIRDAQEVEALLKLPVLGVLPKLPPIPLTLDQIEHFLDRPAAVEPYRLLLRTLDHTCQKQLRSLTVSSVGAGEGKSAVVARLAAVAATLSRPTLVVDADLNQSAQFRVFDLASYPGLSEVVSHDQSLLDAVQPTAIANLDVLTQGQPSARPSAVTESSAMKTLLQDIPNHYPLNLVDTPPISLSADAASLSEYTDGLVLVVQPGLTSRSALQRAVSDLRKMGTPLLGVVVNEAPERIGGEFLRNSVDRSLSHSLLTGLLWRETSDRPDPASTQSHSSMQSRSRR